MIQAAFNAEQTLVAFPPIYLPSSLLRDRDGLFGAGFYATSTSFAINIPNDQIGEEILRFRVGTPETIQGAAFHKNSGSDPGPIVNAESLNIEDESTFSMIKRGSLHKKVLSDLGGRPGFISHYVLNNFGSSPN